MQYAIFRRKDDNYWQGIAGGGRDAETALEAARRETQEEAGLSQPKNFFALKTVSSIPVYHFADHEQWGGHQYIVPAYSFAYEVVSDEIRLSGEHLEFKWVDFETANYMLFWDHDKTALWELNERITKGDMVPTWTTKCTHIS